MLAIHRQVGQEAGAQDLGAGSGSTANVDIAQANSRRADWTLRLAALRRRRDHEHIARDQRGLLVEPGELVDRALLDGQVAFPELLDRLTYLAGFTPPDHIGIHDASSVRCFLVEPLRKLGHRPVPCRPSSCPRLA